VAFDQVSEIQGHAFENSSVTSVNMPTSLSSIGEQAFKKTTNLKISITIPSAVTRIRNTKEL